MALYLIHFERPLGDPSRPRMSARHYLGYSPDAQVEDRIRTHLRGRGAAITRAAVERGIALVAVRVWMELGRETERRWKRAGHHDRRCPVCNPSSQVEG